MIILSDPLHSILLDTTTTADIDYSVTYVDVTTTTFTPSTSEGKITAATSTTIVSAPGSGVQRQIKQITISNTHASASNNCTVNKLYFVSPSQIFPSIELLANQSLQYFDDEGWIHLDKYGNQLTIHNPAGSTTNIQYNTQDSLTASADLSWDNTTKSLMLGGSDTDIVIKGITTEPSPPSEGNLKIYSKTIAGRMHLKFRAPSGWDAPLMPTIWSNAYTIFEAGSIRGTVLTTQGTAVAVVGTATNSYTQSTVSTYSNVVTTQNQQVGIRTEAMFCRGNAAGIGGFNFVCRFGFNSIKTGCRAFIGFTTGTTAIVTGDPSGLTNMLGFGFDLADTAFTFMHNDNAGTCTKETISGQGVLATNFTGYDAYIFCAPNSSTVYYRLDRVDTGETICDSSVTTDLPVNTTMLSAVAVMSNGTANIVAANARIGIIKMSIETDR